MTINSLVRIRADIECGNQVSSKLIMKSTLKPERMKQERASKVKVMKGRNGKVY